jgi:hypothetical protein
MKVAGTCRRREGIHGGGVYQAAAALEWAFTNEHASRLLRFHRTARSPGSFKPLTVTEEGHLEVAKKGLIWPPPQI